MGYISGEEAITILLQKSTDGSTVDLIEKAKVALRELESIMPKGTKYNIIMDTSIDIKSSISGVGSNAIQGLILATIVLFLFLRNVRATFLITLALPISVIFTFAFLKATGTTLNLISLMGLSIGVGMLTDNSVVVIDNIYRHITDVHSPVVEASENGSTEVSASIFASALTTMLVFIPILFIPGFAREIFRDMAYAIIFSNVAALIVALTLIPMLASKLMSNEVKISSDGKIFHKIREKYLRLIRYARSEEHTSELQSRQYLVCRLLLEKKKKKHTINGCEKKKGAITYDNTRLSLVFVRPAHKDAMEYYYDHWITSQAYPRLLGNINAPY